MTRNARAQSYADSHDRHAPQTSIRTQEGLTAHFLDIDGIRYLHRDDGPAVHDPSGNCTWFRFNTRHRDDGPARITADRSEWWQDGALHRELGPAVLWRDGSYEWRLHGRLHRDDGPARANMLMAEWYHHGQRHRADGAAVTYIDGDQEFWLRGRCYPNRAAWRLAACGDAVVRSVGLVARLRRLIKRSTD